MKTKWIYFIALILSADIYLGQNSCCSVSKVSTSFAMLSQNQKFVLSHEEPLPFSLTSPKGKNISYKTPDGKEGFGYEVSSNAKNNNVIFVIHEWWGLNDYVKQEAEKISIETGNRVIALDLYDKKIATNRDSASKFMKSVKSERAQSIINGAIKYVGVNANIATIGWCFGGGWSMQASLLAGKQAKACIIYYGMPEDNLEKLSGLNAPVLFVFAQKDQWINKEVVSKFESNMKSAGKKLTIKSYDAEHAFANPSNPHFEKSFSEDAFVNFKNFIKENLK